LGIEFDEFYTKEVFSSKELMNGRTFSFFKAQSFTLSHSTGHLSRIFSLGFLENSLSLPCHYILVGLKQL
jgi:hypothetical protein